ncbi:MAG: ParB N-terminal domain-containing protein [Caldilineaceae bacterium]
MTEFARLDIKEIRADVPRSTFAEEKIEQLANLILESGGVLRPLVVRQVDIDTYQLVEGALEYYAAARAREKDPRRGELVNAFVVSLKQEEMAKQQLQSFNGSGGSPAATTPAPVGSSDQLSTFVTNFIVGSEARINELREKVFQAERKFESGLTRIEKLVEKEKRPSDLLDIINTLDTDQLVTQLSFYGADKAKIEAICNARRQKKDGNFATYQELLQAAKGLGEKGLLRLIDTVRSYSR